MTLFSRESREEVAFKKLLEYAGDLGVLEDAVKLASQEAGGVPDLQTLLRAIQSLQNKTQPA